MRDAASAVSVIGVNHFRLFGKMELHILWMKKNCHWNYRMWINYKPGPEGEGPLANITEWIDLQEGIRETNTMPGYAGSSLVFSYVIWIRIMIKNFATEKQVITGTRLIYILAEPNMQLAFIV